MIPEMTDLTREQELALIEALENHPGVLSVADKRLAQALKERDEARTALETARMKLRIVRGATRDEHLLAMLGDDE